MILKLGQKITDRIGVKVTENDPEYWGLASVVTDEMAEVALAMKVRVPATAAEVAKKCKKSVERTEELLEKMSVIGVIEYNWENEDHHKQYVLPMFVPVLLPSQVVFCRDSLQYLYILYNIRLFLSIIFTLFTIVLRKKETVSCEFYTQNTVSCFF